MRISQFRLSRQIISFILSNGFEHILCTMHYARCWGLEGKKKVSVLLSTSYVGLEQLGRWKCPFLKRRRLYEDHLREEDQDVPKCLIQ